MSGARDLVCDELEYPHVQLMRKACLFLSYCDQPTELLTETSK